MTDEGRTGRGRWLIAGVVGVVVLAVLGGFLLLREDRDTSARTGSEGTRTFDRAPDDLPEGIVPPDASEVEGTVASGGPHWTAAVSFVTSGTRDEVHEHVDAILRAAGYTFQQRAYDDVSLQVLYDGPDGSSLSVTHETLAEGTGTAVVLQGRRPPPE